MMQYLIKRFPLILRLTPTFSMAQLGLRITLGVVFLLFQSGSCSISKLEWCSFGKYTIWCNPVWMPSQQEEHLSERPTFRQHFFMLATLSNQP